MTITRGLLLLTALQGGWSDIRAFDGETAREIHYYLYTPAPLEPEKRYPLVLWLHGGLKSNGRGGPDLPKEAFYRSDHQKKNPCFVLRPVAVKGENWVSPRGAGTGSHSQPKEAAPSLDLLLKLLDRVVQENPIDRKRLVVTGASMGGYGTWDLITRRPDLFAAAIPICGGADPSKAGSVSRMKIWVFHSADDSIVPVRGSREMFEALMKARGESPARVEDDAKIDAASSDGRIRYTEFKKGGHNSWDRALSNLEVLEWALQF